MNERAQEIVRELLSVSSNAACVPKKTSATAFAPTNIALCKYWGKRDAALHLPMTSSLSIALPNRGATTTIRQVDGAFDRVIVNGEVLAPSSLFVKRLVAFVTLWRESESPAFEFDIEMSIPVAAGLASSAAGFAALVMAFDELYGWGLSKQQQSILARLGSGSAARSFWRGFVEWHAGTRRDGLDSYAEPLSHDWQALRVGILTLHDGEKPLASRAAMKRTVATSPFYTAWPSIVARDLRVLKNAIDARDFSKFGATAEANALAMHATMQTSVPPITYSLPETLAAMQRIWKLREQGLSLYFTQDAGPNLKLLFQALDESIVRAEFKDLDVIQVF